jgi:hypothetical protein
MKGGERPISFIGAKPRTSSSSRSSWDGINRVTMLLPKACEWRGFAYRPRGLLEKAYLGAETQRYCDRRSRKLNRSPI